MSFGGPNTGIARLSFRRSIRIAHSITERMRRPNSTGRLPQ